MNINILLATYNGEVFLEQQLMSILSQTYTKWKLFIHDDNSSDKTKQIIKKYLHEYSEKIVFLDDEIFYRNASQNFMHMLEKIDGDYFMFCDQDDVWLPNKIEITFRKMKELEHQYGANTPLLVFSDLTVVNNQMNIVSKSFWKYQKLNPTLSKNWKKLLAQNVITGCTMMINKKAKNRCLPFEFNIIIYDQWIGVVVSKYGQSDYLDEQTILYRQHEYNNQGAKKFELFYVIHKLGELKKIISYQLRVSSYFKTISVIELMYYKICINLRRLFS